MTASVEITTLSQNCATLSASETAPICYCVSPVLIDEFSGSLDKVKKENLINFAKQLQNDPNTQGNIIWYSEKNLTKAVVEQQMRKIIEYLVKKQNLEKERVTLQTALSNKELVKFFIVPAGASPPTP